MAAVAPFQNAYLSAVLGRLSDGVSAAFPGGSRALASSADLQRLIGCGLGAHPDRAHACAVFMRTPPARPSLSGACRDRSIGCCEGHHITLN